MSAVLSSSPAADLAAVKSRQQAAWSTGDYAVVGTTLQIGPMNKTFGALDAGKQALFNQDLLALMESRNCSGDPTLVLPSEYLEVVIVRK